jgi:hypothetical protein
MGYELREIKEQGNRWLVLDVSGIAREALPSLPGGTAELISRSQERAITDVIVEGLQNAGVAAQLRSITAPPSNRQTMGLVVPVLRLYLPLKDAGRDFYATLVGVVFAHEVGAPPEVLGAVLLPRAVEVLARRMKGLDSQELEVVRAISALSRQLGVPVTGAQLSSNLGRDAEPDLLRLSERNVIRSVEGGWVIDF